MRDVDGVATCLWISFPDTSCGTRALLDTGAGISLLPRNVYDSMTSQPPLQTSDKAIEGANAAPITCHGKADINIMFGPFKCLQTFYVCENDVSPLLGRDFMRDNDVYTRPAHKAVYKDGKKIPAHDLASKARGRVSLITSVTLRPGEELQTVAKVTSKTCTDDVTCVIQPSKSLFWRTGVKVARLLDVPQQKTCRVRILNPSDESVRLWSGQTVGTLANAVQTRPYSVLKSSDYNTAVTARGFDPELDIQKRIDHDLKHVGDKKAKVENKLPTHLTDLFDRAKPELNRKQQSELHNMLSTYRDVFAVDSNDIGMTKWVKHDVDTGMEEPVRQRPRRLRYEQRPVLQNTIKDLHEQGRIRPSNSEWASNVVLVRKKATDPKAEPEWRMCIDYRELNTKTRNKHSYMLPRIDDTLDALNRAKFFCTLDIQQGYHNVQLTQRAIEKTAFHVPCVNPPHWEWTCMPFGLVGAPRTFQRLMDRMLRGLEHKIALAYLDDVIVYGSTVDETLKNLDQIFERILAAGVKLKAKKCHLFKRETTYLGHAISHEGVKTEPAKVEAVNAWHAPRTIKQLRSFLGMVCYYSKFIKNFADISQPLYALLKGKRKIKELDWTDLHQSAFRKLKNALVSAPILAYPTQHGQYILDTDASQFACGAVLTQVQKDDSGQDVERVIAYYSKIYNDAEQRYCARRRELLAIKKATQHFEVYLRGPKFIIRTDHASLQYIKTVTNMNDQMYRWVLDMEVFDYVIQIRPGKDHTNADTLSRIPCAGKICICEQVEEFEKRSKMKVEDFGRNAAGVVDGSSISELIASIKFKPKWSNEELQTKQLNDLDLGPVYKAKKADETRPPWESYSIHSAACKAYFAEWNRLELHNDILYRRWENPAGTVMRLQILIPRDMQREICRHVHDGKAAAHLGKKRTLKLLARSVHWYKMDHDVSWWIKTCPVCQRRKKPQANPHAPSKPYISGCFNERVAMDIVGPMKKTQRGNIYILTITDHFTKFSRAVALPDQRARTIADAFLDRWVNDFQPPLQLHTDQGANFESELMQQVCELFRIEKTRTTAYHPQGNAQCERLNQSIVQALAKLVDKDTFDDWDEQLPIAVAAYNATLHASTGYTPNRLLYGRELPHELERMLPAQPATKYDHLDDYVQQLRRNQVMAYDATRIALGKSVLAQKRNYDRKQNLHHYKTGDTVMLKDFTQSETGTKKFKDKYKGPYYVVDALSDIHFRITRAKDQKPKIVHHDAMELMQDREPEDLSWVYNMSRTFKQNKPTSLRDVTTAVDDMMRRLKQVETHIHDPRVKTRQNRRNRTTRHQSASNPDESAPTRTKKNDSASSRTNRNDPVTRRLKQKQRQLPRIDPAAAADADTLLYKSDDVGDNNPDSTVLDLADVSLNESEILKSPRSTTPPQYTTDHPIDLQPKKTKKSTTTKPNATKRVRPTPSVLKRPPTVRATTRVTRSKGKLLQQQGSTQPIHPDGGVRRSARPRKPKIRED